MNFCTFEEVSYNNTNLIDVLTLGLYWFPNDILGLINFLQYAHNRKDNGK